MTQTRFMFQDEADAHDYWREKEFKKFAVDVRTGRVRNASTRITVYVRARTHDAAIACARRNLKPARPSAQYVARLAGSHELGCVPTPLRAQSE